ncbi:hypothetical protein MTO96_010821 [Rhipicephalus appendiculatus]
MVIKMYVSGISASKEVKKNQQRALMILESIKEYCGDFEDFDQATEEDRLILFLKLDPAEYNLNGSHDRSCAPKACTTTTA